MLPVEEGSRRAESDFAGVEVSSAVVGSSGALEECIAEKDVESMFVNWSLIFALFEDKNNCQ